MPAGSQVTVKVLYFGPIVTTVGVPEEWVGLPAGATVGELVAALVERHGDAFREALLWTDGSPLPNAVILLDGKNVLHHGGMDTPIERDGSAHIVLMTAATGGG